MEVSTKPKMFAFSFPTEAYKPLLAGLTALIVLFLSKEYILVLVDADVANIQIGASSGQLLDDRPKACKTRCFRHTVPAFCCEDSRAVRIACTEVS